MTRSMAALLRGDLRPRRRRGLGAVVLAVFAGQLASDARRVLGRSTAAPIEMSTLIHRPTTEVWDDIRDIASHVDWMQDAEAIRFTSDSREGVGTAFECDTKVGPFRLIDPMYVTEWSDESRVMAIRHEGMVKGTGRFSVEPAGSDQACFLWQEQLRFPWYMGGSLGSAAAAGVMRFVWRRNLSNLKHRLERT